MTIGKAHDARLAQLAENLRTAVKASGLSNADVSRALEVDGSSVSRWLSGDRTPTIENLLDVADLAGVHVAELFRDPVTPPRTKNQNAMASLMAMMPIEQQRALLALAATMVPAPGERDEPNEADRPRKHA